MSQSPFGATAVSGPAPAPSTFSGAGGLTSGTQAPFKSPFGSNNTKVAPSPTPFGQSVGVSPTPFGAPAGPSASFGQVTAAMPSSTGPFGSAPAPAPPLGTPGTFGGKNPRDILAQFYQQYNPTKLAEVDKLLAKYAGREEQMFRNLANKYNIDPSLFGLPGNTNTVATAPSQFGAQPSGGSGGSFGQSSSLGGRMGGLGGGMISSPTPFGKAMATAPAAGGVFGASSGTSANTGFGSLASTNSPGFANAASSPFSGQSGGFGSNPGGFGSMGTSGVGGAAGGSAGGTSGFGGAAGSSAGGGFGAMGGTGGAGFGAPSGGFASPFGGPRR